MILPNDRPLAITPGEPAGIGPDLAVLYAQDPQAPAVLIADRDLLAGRARLLGLPFEVPDYAPERPPGRGPGGVPACTLLHVPLARPALPGRLDPANGTYVLDTLRRATHGCLDGEFAALVTLPVHKGVINDAGFAFTGHTEYLAELTGTARVVMMLVGGGLRVALATTHLALKDVPAALTADALTRTLEILDAELRGRFGLPRPRILVAGLNPHAGESGHLGREEIEVIAPAVEALKARGLRLDGPLPADTLFQPRYLREADAVLAMYHDQGLPVLKYASFGGGVNVTLGLPIVRTSVDHGTALDLAGRGAAGRGSMDAAVRLAVELAGRGPAQRAP